MVEIVHKKLIFHFYGSEDYKENIANKVHFYCLNYYSKIFNEAIIVISVKDINNINLINDIKKSFIEIIHSTQLTFKVVKNTIYYEAQTFKEEIIENISNFEGITFFGHNKGYSNVKDKNKSVYSIINWICAMYYFNLNNIEEVCYSLNNNLHGVFYGSFLMATDYISNNNKIWYAGTFYWGNYRRIYNFLNNKNKTIPPIFDKSYAEWLPGELFEWNNGSTLCSHSNKLIYQTDLYNNSISAINFFLNENEKKDFNIFKDEMLRNINYFKYSILTYNFGEYEIMREIENKQDDVEYIYVTDDKNLKSNTWKIIIDEDLKDLSLFEKVNYVRYNPFKYCSTPLCVKMNASIKINNSIDDIIKAYKKDDYDFAIIIHPERNNFEEEYSIWENTRNLSKIEKEEVLSYFKENNYKLNYKGLYESGFVICNNNLKVNKINTQCLNLINYFKDKGIKIRVDQIILSYILNNNDKNIKVLPLNHSIIQSSNLTWMVHGSDKYKCEIKVKDDKGFLFNKEVNLNKF